MIKRTIRYKDWNDVDQVEDFHFHLTVPDVMENLFIIDETDAVDKIIAGQPRELTTEEKQRILNLVKEMIRLSYGVRSEDGRFFRKRPEYYYDFRDSKAYETFILELFTGDQAEAFEFILSVFDAETQAKAREEISKRGDTPAAPSAAAPVAPSTETPMDTVGEVKEKKPTDYSEDELHAMPYKDFVDLVGTDPTKMDPAVMRIAWARKATEG